MRGQACFRETSQNGSCHARSGLIDSSGRWQLKEQKARTASRHASHSAPFSLNFAFFFGCVGSRELLSDAIGCAQVTELL